MAENKELKVSISSNLDATGFNQAQSKIKDLSSNTDKLSASFKTFAGVAASLGAVALFKDQITKTLDFADSLNKLSQKTGITADGLYALSAAAELSDIDFTSLEGSLSKFSKGIGEASMGTGNAKNAFERLGVSIKNQDGTLKDSYAILVELADKFKDMPDGASKATTAMELFGKSGADMIPLLNSGGEALRKYLGIMDEETAKAAEEFKDSLTSMNRAMNIIFVKTVKELSPTFTVLANDFLDLADNSDELGDSLSQKLAVAMKGVVKWGYGITSVFDISGDALSNFGKSIGALLAFDETGTQQYFEKIGTDFGKGIDKWGKLINDLDKAEENYAQNKEKRQKKSGNKFDFGLTDSDAEREKAKKQATEYAKAYKDISDSLAKTSMDDYDYGVYLINQKVEEYRKSGVKELEIAQYVTNAKMELGIKQLQTETKEYEKAQQEKKQAIEHELKMLEEQYRIQSRQVSLLDDEVDRTIALAKIEHDRSVQSLRLQMEKEPELKALYEMELDYEDQLLSKTLENYTLHGQVIRSLTDDLESGFEGFFDYASDGFLDFGNLAKNILHEVYMEILRVAIIKPLVGGLTNMAMGAFTANAQGGVYDSPSLSSYSNQVVSSPTLFAFASGGVPNMGVFGEAGSEAIMPLTRTTGGDLGVKAVGGVQNMKIEIINQTSQGVEVSSATQRMDTDGMVLSIVIDGINKNKYGLRDMIGGR